MIDRLLGLSNQWWREASISKEKAKNYHRESFGEIEKLVKYRQVVIVTGLRRTGKTTLLFQIIERLLKKEDPRKILYFNFDEKSIEPLDILKEYSRITNIDWQKEKIYVFLMKSKK